MVSMQNESGQRAKNLCATPLCANSPVPPSQLFPLPKYRPRAGRGTGQVLWLDGVGKLCNAFGYALEGILAGPPPQPSGYAPDSSSSYTPFVSGGDGWTAADAASMHMAVMRDFAARKVAWQRASTAIYWHVYPSLDITGVSLVRDLRAINNLTAVVDGQPLADAGGLIRWVLSFGATDSQDSQFQLITKLATTKLKTGSSCAQLYAHAQTFLEDWKLLDGASVEEPAKLVKYYEYLLYSLPTQPEGSHLVGVRSWLAGRVADFKQGGAQAFTDPDEAIDAIRAHALVLGVPAGDERSAETGAERPGVRVTQPSETPPKTTDCGMCDAYDCTSVRRATDGGRCLGHKDSSFDLTQLSSKGGARFLKGVRTAHAANPSLKTLKRIRFVKRKGGGQGSGSKDKGAERVTLLHSLSLKEPDESQDDFDAWLAKLSAAGPGIRMIRPDVVRYDTESDGVEDALTDVAVDFDLNLCDDCGDDVRDGPCECSYQPFASTDQRCACPAGVCERWACAGQADGLCTFCLTSTGYYRNPCRFGHECLCQCDAPCWHRTGTLGAHALAQHAVESFDDVLARVGGGPRVTMLAGAVDAGGDVVDIVQDEAFDEADLSSSAAAQGSVQAGTDEAAAAAAAVNALVESRALIAQRDSELQACRREAEQLRAQLSALQLASPSQPQLTARVPTPPTKPMIAAVANPALVPPDPSLLSTSSGGGLMASPPFNSPLIMPIGQSEINGSGKKSAAKMTALEHVASALVLNEQQLAKAKSKSITAVQRLSEQLSVACRAIVSVRGLLSPERWVMVVLACKAFAPQLIILASKMRESLSTALSTKLRKLTALGAAGLIALARRLLHWTSTKAIAVAHGASFLATISNSTPTVAMISGAGGKRLLDASDGQGSRKTAITQEVDAIRNMLDLFVPDTALRQPLRAFAESYLEVKRFRESTYAIVRACFLRQLYPNVYPSLHAAVTEVGSESLLRAAETIAPRLKRLLDSVEYSVETEKCTAASADDATALGDSAGGSDAYSLQDAAALLSRQLEPKVETSATLVVTPSGKVKVRLDIHRVMRLSDVELPDLVWPSTDSVDTLEVVSVGTADMQWLTSTIEMSSAPLSMQLEDVCAACGLAASLCDCACDDCGLSNGMTALGEPLGLCQCAFFYQMQDEDWCGHCGVPTSNCDCTVCDLCGESDSPWHMLCMCMRDSSYGQHDTTRMCVEDGSMLTWRDLAGDAMDEQASIMALRASAQKVNALTQSQRKSFSQRLEPTDEPDGKTCTAGLFDDGASLQTACSRTLDGALLDTFSDMHAGSLRAANADSGLVAQGSYIYLHKRWGSDGRGEVVARRMRHTPNLDLPLVYAEPDEVHRHGYTISWTADAGRVLTSPEGVTLLLHMTELCLGYSKVQPVVDPDEQAQYRAIFGLGEGSMMVLGDGTPRSTGMPNDRKLRGVELLRREHLTRGHPPLRKLMATLAAMRLPEGTVTRSDFEQFAKEGCGSCESERMRRRSFKIKTVVEHVPAPVGKAWHSDSLSLRVPSADHGFISVRAFIDSSSGKPLLYGMHGETAEDIIKAENKHRAAVRPDHGEIWIVRMDSHPSHRSLKMDDFMADEESQLQLSPGHVHEGVHLAEGFFNHAVPSANATLAISPDLGERHFYSALQTAAAGWEHTITEGTDPPTSPIMRYKGATEFIRSPLLLYGSACKALVHPEARESKYDSHAFPAVYTGPAMNSRSPVHCSVWDGTRYVDVDVGCVNIDERAVIARSHRNHASHQPFNQPSGASAPATAPSTEQWFDPRVELHPSAVARSRADSELASFLPWHEGSIWLSSSPVPTTEFSIGMCSGRARAADITSWMYHLSGGAHDHIRIDPHVGGYGHFVQAPPTLTALVQLARHSRCALVVMQLPCAPWAVARFLGGKGGDAGPAPIFDSAHPDGKLDEAGVVRADAARAMCVVDAGVQVARTVLSHDGMVLSEHPVCQGRDSLHAGRGTETHSTMHQTAPFVSLAADYGMLSVSTDLCRSDHQHRLSRDLLVCRRLHPFVERMFAPLKCNHKTHGEPLRGRDDDGAYRTKSQEPYSPLMAQRVASVCLEALTAHRQAAPAAADEGGVNAANADTTGDAHDVPTPVIEEVTGDATTPIVDDVTNAFNATAELIKLPAELQPGTRVEVWWSGTGPLDNKWYSGVVTEDTPSLEPHKYTVKGMRRRCAVFEILYDDGVTNVHSIHNTDYRLEADYPTLQAIIDERAERVLALTTADVSLNKCKWARELFEHDTSRPGEVFVLTDVQFDMETGELVNKSSIYYTDGKGKIDKVTSMNTTHARHWHQPTNEREYNRSPQRDLWRTAKELKWGEYLDLNMFKWVPIDTVDTKVHRIYSTLWAYKIKLDSELNFKKLNPRWCFKGGTMDRDLYKSHAEQVRMVTLRIIFALKGGYWDALCTFLLDCSNAFQATRTDDDEKKQELYCYPAPGFERRDHRGVKLVCKVLVAMQGRIDATKLFNTKLFGLLLKAGIVRMTWDKQACIYDASPLKNTDASLSEVLTSIKEAKDTAPQQPPVGWALLGWHVDDSAGVACGVGWDLEFTTNRVALYLRGTIEVIYATTMTGWHGNKMLGITLTLDESDKSVELTAPDLIGQLAKDLLGDTPRISPKHISTKDFYDIPPSPLPPPDDPSFPEAEATAKLCRHGLGVMIYGSNAYVQAQPPTNELCVNMQHPGAQVLKCLRYMLMHLLAHPCGPRYGGDGKFGLERPEGVDVSKPLSSIERFRFHHHFSDANLKHRSVSGGVGMLACGPIQTISQRQHLASPDSHTSEVVSAGTNVNYVVPTNGVLQELRIRLGQPTPFYLDSATTVFVSKDEASIKKSVWLIRRAAVACEAAEHSEIEPIHIPEYDMVADPFTKYLPYSTWARLSHYLLNKKGAIPERASGM